MSIQFKSILVPVDFSINTEVAIAKAMEIADVEKANIHLLHILPASRRKSRSREQKLVFSDGMNQSYASRLLEELKENIELSNKNIEVTNWVFTHGGVQEKIIEKTLELKPDLIVIGKRSRQQWFRFRRTVIPAEISLATQSAILTVKPGALHNKIRTIVVPVQDCLPEQKMDVIMALCKRSRIKVHLITFLNGQKSPDVHSSASLLKMYQWLKESMHCPVEYSVLSGHFNTQSVLRYAERNNADILLLHSISETVSGWMNQHIIDMLPPQSKVQVLSVQPFDQ